jgi:hypothetical protein
MEPNTKLPDTRGSLPPQRLWETLDDLRDQHTMLRSKVAGLHADIITAINNLESLRDSTLKLFESREGYLLERLRLIEGAIIEIGRTTGLFTADMEETLKQESENEIARDQEDAETEADALMQGAGEVIGGAVITTVEEDDDAPKKKA